MQNIAKQVWTIVTLAISVWLPHNSLTPIKVALPNRDNFFFLKVFFK